MGTINPHERRKGMWNEEGKRIEAIEILNVYQVAVSCNFLVFEVLLFLQVLQNVTGVNLKLFMNCREKLSELPLKRFYRYVLEPQITFDTDSGNMNPGPFAQFLDMPETTLLTTNMDTPLGWMVQAVWSPHDLDNIRLSEVSSSSFHGSLLQSTELRLE